MFILLCFHLLLIYLYGRFRAWLVNKWRVLKRRLRVIIRRISLIRWRETLDAHVCHYILDTAGKFWNGFERVHRRWGCIFGCDRPDNRWKDISLLGQFVGEADEVFVGTSEDLNL